MSDISLLFARDPLTLTTEDVDAIIRDIRVRRTSFGGAAKPKAATKPKRQTKAAKLIEGLDEKVIL